MHNDVLPSEGRGITNGDSSLEYHKVNNRELKISRIEKNDSFQQEIDLTIKHRISNQLRNDHQKELLYKGYKLKNRIGSGSFSHVFRARDLRIYREVAIKLIELDKCSTYYKDFCLRNEIYVIRKLSHENIVRFYEAFNTSMAYVMVMEMIENGTFAKYLHKNGGPISDESARKLFKGVFNGVYYMHERLIAHRDLKLENLLLNRNNEPKIVDFSLSVIWNGRRLLTDWCGTPPYFSPEILQRKPYIPLCCDIWSLGICLYAMLNDTIPFNCDDNQKMLQKQLNREWKFRAKYERNISDDLKNLIREMLEPDMYARIKIDELVQRLVPKN